MSAEDRRTPADRRRPVRKPLYVKTAVVVVCGPQQVNPNARAHVDEGWLVEEHDKGVDIGRTYVEQGGKKRTYWAMVPWDSIQFVAYEAEETA